MIALLALLACNDAPLDYALGKAPRAQSAWFHPSDDFCDLYDEDQVRVDGYAWCGTERAVDVVAVDDPVYVTCRDAPAPAADETALTVFDGVEARAYSLAWMMGRELVHDDWRGEPVVVDF